MKDSLFRGALAICAILTLLTAGWAYIEVKKAIFIVAVIEFGLLLLAYTTTASRFSAWLSGLNGVALFALALPVVDYCLEPAVKQNDGLKPAYSLAIAKKTGGSFKLWWNEFSRIWTKDFREKLVEPDPEGLLPYIPRIKACMEFFEGKVCTNSLRLIGPELKYSEDEAFRILTIGESTTQGVPLDSEYLPWPRVLEHLINERLTCSQPIEVLNAGVAGYTIRDSVKRLEARLLPLKPQIILSYHGANSFPLLFKSVPSNRIVLPPRIADRPSYLIRRLEFRWRTREFYRKIVNWNVSDKDLMESSLADEYRKLIKIVRDNEIQLIFLTYNLSIDENSPEEAISFYKQGFPGADWAITINRIQTTILQNLGKEFNVPVIDTSKHLNGTYDRDNFIDLVHFTKKGDIAMAKNVLDGLIPHITSNPSLLCHEK